MKNFGSDQLIVGIVGAGTMGRGIAQIAATAGLTVRWYDLDAEQLEQGIAFVQRMLDRQQEKGNLAAAVCAQAKACLTPARELAALCDADVVIEAIVEQIGPKQALFRQLEALVSDTCIIASNTSSIPIAALAADARLPARFAGLHFFNPVPLMRIVEVIAGLRTSPEVVTQLEKLGTRMGHYAPRVSDTPGFLVNHAGRGYGLEAMRIESEGIATPVEIDRILCDVAGFKMGPFALSDLIGIDVSLAVMESIYALYYQEPRYKPPILIRQYRNAGLLGKKTGKGFYDYDAAGKPFPVPEQGIPKGKSSPVWLGINDPAVRGALARLFEQLDCRLDTGSKPASDSLCLVAPLGQDTTTCALQSNLPPERTVAIDTLLGLKERVCLMASPVIDKPMLHNVAHLLVKSGRRVSLIHDSCGFVVQRVLANIVNISCEIAQQGIALPADINKAVQLGLGYPMGPLSFGDAIGPGRILSILDHLHQFYQEPRYRPSPWLKRRALLGVSLSTLET